MGRLLELLDQQLFNFPTIADTAELGKLSLFKDHSSNLQSDYTTACSFIISVFPFIFTEILKKNYCQKYSWFISHNNLD